VVVLSPTMQANKDNSGSGSSSSTTPNPQGGGGNIDSNSGGVGSAMGGSLAGVDLGPSMLSAAGPAATSGPSIPAGTGPGGTPTTALSVYHLITQLCQRPDPTAMSNAAKGILPTQQGQVPAMNATGAEALAGSSTQRETALLELSKKREQYEDLALVLWHSFGM
jgi:CCR4-NOT transcription complex subunit 9